MMASMLGSYALYDPGFNYEVGTETGVEVTVGDDSGDDREDTEEAGTADGAITWAEVDDCGEFDTAAGWAGDYVVKLATNRDCNLVLKNVNVLLSLL